MRILFEIFDFKAWNNVWKSWEHALFSVNADYKWSKMRALSIASNHEEWILKFATKISDKSSEYKKYLMTLKAGDKIKMRWPFGWFYLQDETTPVVMIAWGIWITPFRSIMLSLKDSKREAVLLYSSNDGYLFEDEFNDIVRNNPNIKLVYISWRKELEEHINNYIVMFNNNAHYFISWAPEMIKSVKKNLKNKWVRNIFSDLFYWYN